MTDDIQNQGKRTHVPIFHFFRISRFYRALKLLFNRQEQKILFEKYKECCMDMYGIAELEAFVSGVKLGVNIIVETYTDSSHNFKEI